MKNAFKETVFISQYLIKQIKGKNSGLGLPMQRNLKEMIGNWEKWGFCDKV